MMANEVKQPKRIMLVDDHELFRNGIASLLNAQPDMEVVAEAGDGLEAQFRAPALLPDLILMDINMPGVDGLEALNSIRSELPEVIIIMLTVHDEDDKVFDALRAGANGYILKNSNSEDFLRMLRDALTDGATISPALTSRVIAEFSKAPKSTFVSDNGEKLPTITKRERDVLGLVCEGLTDKEVALKLSISLHTVKSHMRNILSKLKVKSRHEAAEFALRSHIV